MTRYWKWKEDFWCFCEMIEYSALTVIHNVWRVKIASNIISKPTSFTVSSSWYSCSTFIGRLPVYSLLGDGKKSSNSFKSWNKWSCLSCEKEGPGSVTSKFLANVWNVSTIPRFTVLPKSYSLTFNPDTSMPTWIELWFSLEMT